MRVPVFSLIMSFLCLGNAYAQSYSIQEGYLFYNDDSNGKEKIIERKIENGKVILENVREFGHLLNLLRGPRALSYEKNNSYFYKDSLLIETYEESKDRNIRTVFFYSGYGPSRLVKKTSYTFDKQGDKNEWAWEKSHSDVIYEYSGNKLSQELIYHTAWPDSDSHRTTIFYNYDEKGREKNEIEVDFNNDFRFDKKTDTCIRTYTYFNQGYVAKTDYGDYFLIDSIFTDNKNRFVARPLTSIIYTSERIFTNTENRVVARKHHARNDFYTSVNYYDTNGLLVRSVTEGYEDHEKKKATIVYKYK